MEVKGRKSSGAGLLPRRSFLQATAAGSVALAMPWSVRRAVAYQGHDLVVIGGGTAGIPAAIFAADRGARVVIVEKAPVLGGTLFLSGGLLAAASTVFQKRLGVEDSPGAHLADIMRITNNTSDPMLARLWTDHGGLTVNWLAKHGFTVRDGHPYTVRYNPFSGRRFHQGPHRGMSILNTMMPLLNRHVAAGRVTVLTETAAVDLIKDSDGTVSGVITEDSNGKRYDVRGRNIILSSGGCAANPTLFFNLHGVPLYRNAAYPYSQGAGLLLGLSAGGHLRGAENYAGYYGSVPADDQIPSMPSANMILDPERRPPWEVFVNARGERFIREDHPSMNIRDLTMDRQPGHCFWAIFDHRIFNESSPLIADWSREQMLKAFDSHPMFTRAVSLGELGVLSGINPAELAKSILDYNQALEKNVPDQFWRSFRPGPVSKPPFYAIRSQAWTLRSYAGIAVNENLQVITDAGEPVPNLYAAGEVLGATTTGKGHVMGGQVTPALTFGRLLGRQFIRF